MVRYWGSDCNPNSTSCGVFLVSSQISLFLILMIFQGDIYLLDSSLKYRKKKKAAKMMLSEEEGGSGNSDR